MRYDVGAKLPVGLNVDQLTKSVSPGGKGDMEGVPMPLYDTQQYVSTVTTSLTFFTLAAAAGNFASNMTQGGQLPNPDFHVVQCITLDVMGLDPVVGATTNDQDLYYILNGITAGQSPFVSLKFASKDYGPWPITALHGTGGVTGSLFGTAAGTPVENANNSVPDGGVWIGGAIVIPPLQAFSVTIQWPAAVTLTTTPLWLKVGLWGTYYRQIH